jgi:hypothetical protein
LTAPGIHVERSHNKKGSSSFLLSCGIDSITIPMSVHTAKSPRTLSLTPQQNVVI